MRGIVNAFLKQVMIWFLLALLACAGASFTVWFFWIRVKRLSFTIENPLKSIALPVVIGLIFVFAAQYFFNRGLKPLRREGRLHARLQSYRTLLMLRWFLLSSAVMSALFMVIFTRNIMPFYLSIVLYVFLLLHFPGRRQAYGHIDLDSLKE